jgi:hypothetical protein
MRRGSLGGGSWPPCCRRMLGLQNEHGPPHDVETILERLAAVEATQQALVERVDQMPTVFLGLLDLIGPVENWRRS